MSASDFEKPFETVKSLLSIQAEAIQQSIAQQKKTSDELTAFFQSETEKAKALKSPEDVIAFNIEANKALFDLIKAQGDAYTAIATGAREAAMEEVSKLSQ
ncbi:MAG: hypothetical protein ACPGMR_10895 [Pontibacterium sp.]